jgi:hypothetical protein
VTPTPIDFAEKRIEVNAIRKKLALNSDNVSAMISGF